MALMVASALTCIYEVHQRGRLGELEAQRRLLGRFHCGLLGRQVKQVLIRQQHVIQQHVVILQEVGREAVAQRQAAVQAVRQARGSLQP